MGSEWTAANEFTDKHIYDLMSQQDIDTLKDFDFVDFEVQTIPSYFNAQVLLGLKI